MAPVTVSCSSRGVHCIRTMTSGRRSTSSVTGQPARKAQSSAASSIPSSDRRRPSTTSLTPMRCRALMAFGDA